MPYLSNSGGPPLPSSATILFQAWMNIGGTKRPVTLIAHITIIIWPRSQQLQIQLASGFWVLEFYQDLEQ